MKRHAFSKILSFVLVAALTLALATTLFACVKDPSDDAAKRAESAANIRDSFIAGMNNAWRGDMSDADAAALSDAGDYVVALEWTELMCDVLEKSSLQTSKLQLVATTLAGEDGKKLFEDFSENATLLLPMLRTVGLTQADVGNLIYDLLYAVVDKSGEVFDKMARRLRDVRSLASRAATLENIVTNITRVEDAKSTLVTSVGNEKSNILSAFSAAKQPLSALVAFVYNMSVGTLNDALLTKLTDGSGALADITDSEISVVMGQLVNNVSALKTSLGDDGTDKLDAALKIVIDKFDVDVITSSVYGELVRYAKYGYMAIDAIPAFCDLVTSVGELLRDSSFVGLLRSGVLANAADDEKLALFNINSAIASARICQRVMSAFSEQSLLDLIDGMSVRGTDYQRSVPIMLIDLAYNFSEFFGSVDEAQNSLVAHPDILSADDFAVMLNAIFFFVPNFDKFKMTYSDFKAGRVDLTALATAATNCRFSVFDIEGAPILQADSSPEVVRMWYEFFTVGDGCRQIEQRIKDCRDKAALDLKAFVNDYVKEGSVCQAAVKELAAMPVQEGDISNEEIERCQTLIDEGNLFGMVALLYFAFTNG